MTFKINGFYIEPRQPDATIAGCIEIYENAWPDPKKTIDELEQLTHNHYSSNVYWQKAETFGQGAFQNIRTNKLLPLTHLCEVTGNKVLHNINNIFYTLLLSTTNSYCSRFDIHENFFHEGYNVLKYSPGEEYKPHYDGGTSSARSVSAICYLNNDYVGGELEFVNFGIKIKPEPGMMLLFPSNYAYRHVAHPVLEGTKYAIVTWVRDRQV